MTTGVANEGAEYWRFGRGLSGSGSEFLNSAGAPAGSFTKVIQGQARHYIKLPRSEQWFLRLSRSFIGWLCLFQLCCITFSRSSARNSPVVFRRKPVRPVLLEFYFVNWRSCPLSYMYLFIYLFIYLSITGILYYPHCPNFNAETRPAPPPRCRYADGQLSASLAWHLPRGSTPLLP